MAAAKTVWFCTSCGNESPKWMGRCPACGEWNTMVEEPKKEIKPVVKTSDEKLMDSLAFINLILGIVGIIALIATGFIVEANRDPYLEGPDLRPILAGVGVVLVLPVLLQYACLRLFTNISHRLSSMDKKMDEK